MAVDIAGIFVERVDKSQGPVEAVSAMFQASSINSERGFINKVNLVSDKADFRTIYGDEDYRKYGYSCQDVVTALGSKIPHYVVRAGNDDWKIATLGIAKNPTVQAFQASSVAYSEGDIVSYDSLNYRANRDIEPVGSTGTVKFVTNPTAGDTLIVDDGSNDAITYQFGGTLSVATNILVEIGLNAIVTASNLNKAIGLSADAGLLLINSYYSSGYSFLTLINSNSGVSGNIALVSSNATDVVVDGMSEGADLSVPTLDGGWDEISDAESLKYNTKVVTAEGLTQAELGSFETGDIARISARGEGAWANDISIEGIRVTNSYDGVDSNHLAEIVVRYKNIIVKSHIVSRDISDLDENGVTMYFVDVLQESDYIRGIDNDTEEDLELSLIFSETQLSGGLNTSELDSTDFANALRIVTDYPEKYDAMVVLNAGKEISTPEFTAISSENALCLGLDCLERSDALGTISSTDIVEKRASVYASNYEGVALLGQWVDTTESSSGRSIIAPPIGFMAYNYGVMAQNGELAKSPAGERRGSLTGASGVSRDFNGANRVILAGGQIIPIKSSKEGNFFWWDKNTKTANSAYQNLNVWMAFLVISRGVTNAYNGFEFEFNDEETVGQLTDILDDMNELWINKKFLEEGEVNSDQNVIGSEEIIITYNVRFKGIARIITVQVVAHPLTQELSVSLAS